jgi:acyl dehydratase
MPQYQPATVFYDELQVGEEISTLHWFVTPYDIEQAADMFHDDNAVYSSKSFAQGTEWGGIVAPFYFLDATFRWANFVAASRRHIGEYTINAHGVLESFLPIRPGDRLTGTMWVHEKFVKRERNFLTWRIEVKNEEGELVARKFWRSYWTGRKITYPTKESYR